MSSHFFKLSANAKYYRYVQSNSISRNSCRKFLTPECYNFVACACLCHPPGAPNRGGEWGEIDERTGQFKGRLRGAGREAPRLPNDDGGVTGLPPLRRDFRRSSGAVEHGKAPTGCTVTNKLHAAGKVCDAQVRSTFPKVSILLAENHHWFLLSARWIDLTTPFLFHQEILKYHTSIYTEVIFLQNFPSKPNIQFYSVLTNSMTLSS